MTNLRILVDTNIFLDVFQRDPVWMPWSAQQLRLGQTSGSLVINMVVYAELLGHPKFDFDLDAFLQHQDIEAIYMSPKASRAAAMAFREHRQRGGSKTGTSPDFFIGAQAQAEGWTLLLAMRRATKRIFPISNRFVLTDLQLKKHDANTYQPLQAGPAKQTSPNRPVAGSGRCLRH